MKVLYKKIILASILGVWAYPLWIHAQCDPTPQLCNRNECNFENVQLALVAEGQNIFCEGEEAVVEIDESRSLNFDFLVYYWCDGVVDTIGFNEQPARHVYNISDEDRCNNTENLFFVTVIGFKECAEGITCRSVAATVTIKYKPQANFSIPSQICITEDLPITDASCNGESYRWNFGDGATSDQENPSHRYSQPGNYTVRLEVTNSCGTDIVTRNVQVVGEPDAAFSYTSTPASQCAPTTVDFTNQSNQWSNTVWTISPNDTTAWRFTDTSMSLGSRNISVRFLRPGEYTVTLSANNVCQDSDEQEETITINQPIGINLPNPGVFCEPTTLNFRDLNPSITGDVDTYQWTFQNGSIPSFNGEEFPDVTFNQSGSITLTARGPCGEVTRSVPVSIASSEPIAFGDNPEQLCSNGTTVQLQATPAGGIWSGTSNASDDAISPAGQLDPSRLNPGTYTFRYSAGSAECPNEDQLTIEILEPPTVDLRPIDPACESLTFNAQGLVRYSGTIDTYQWTFTGGNPATSSDPTPSGVTFANPGTAKVVIEVDGACGAQADSIEIDIQSNTAVSIDPVNGPICSGSSPITLSADVPGGIWTGNGISDRFDGIFDPGRVNPGQTYTITYTIENGACSNSATTDIQVVASENVTIQDASFCEDSAPRAIQVNPGGGTWSGSGIEPTTGVFDPASVGPGNYTVEYMFVDANNCEVTGSAEVQVDALPTISTLDTLELCESDFDLNLPQAFNFQVDPSGGSTSWSGPGVINSNGTFNASDGGLSQGNYTLFIRYTRNECVVIDSAVVKIIQPEALMVSPDTTVCADGSLLQLEANLSGGVWSGPAVNPSEGTVDLDRAGGGTFTYTYTFGQNTSCEQSASVRVEIIDLSEIVDAGEDIQICEGPASYTLQGASPADGSWSGPGLIDNLTGEIDLAQLELNREYTYTYCIESDRIEACEACSERTFVVYSNPIAAFELDGLACVNETFRMINNSEFGSRYEWNFGDGNSSTLREPEHRYSRRGTYTITLTTISREGCRDQASRELFITTAPNAAFDIAEKEACAPLELDLTNRSTGDDIRFRWEIDGMFYDTIVPENVVLDRVTQDSMFAIKLNVSNLCGEVQAVDSVLVRPYPLAGFGISEDEGCSPLEVSFANVTLGDPDFLEWDNGKGQTFSSFNLPPQIYTTTDTTVSEYTVTLRASNECGADTLSKTITVYPPDVEAFIEMDTLRGCDPLELQVKSFSTPGSRIGWQFIDPLGKVDGSTEKDPVFVFDEPGIHTIILFASQCGTDTDTATLEILEAPEVEFMHSDFVCVGDSILFINNSENITGSEWDFGDGNFSDQNSPFHTFDSAGTYQVSLTGYSSFNNCPATAISEVEVIANPTARFSPSAINGCSPLRIDFTNNSTGNTELRYRWRFGDGSSDSFEENPQHTFEEPGNYTVQLIVFDDFSCFSDTSVVNIFVYDDPVAAFSFEEKTYCLGHDEVVLLNESEDAVAYNWQFQGQSATQENPIFTPTDFGTFDIELIVENTFQCRDTIRRRIAINPSPIASFNLDYTEGCENLLVGFSNSSDRADTYFWNFGDGGTSTDESTSYLFEEPGVYEVVLTAINSNGCPNDQADNTITVYEKPTADFEFDKPEVCGAPVEVNFQNNSIGNADNSWTFGDGSRSDATSPNHEYVDIGPKTVELIIANLEGCRDTIQKVVDIFGKPLASFTPSVLRGCERQPILFTNNSIEANRYIWNITGREPIEEISPSVTFESEGSYEVELIAIYNELCQDTTRLDVPLQIFRTPVADFTFQVDPSPEIIGDVQFFNRSFFAERYEWDFGDGNRSTLENPLHEYDVNGPLTVMLMAFNDNGGQFTCIDTTSREVNPEAIATFFAPNAFSPEYGPQGVRVFKPVGLGLTKYKISVYSPNGQLVWQSDRLENAQPAEAWDGTFGGALLPQGAYVWMAELEWANGEKRIRKGTVTVLR